MKKLMLLSTTAVLTSVGYLQAQPATPALSAGDKFVLPSGAGTKDGSSWANAAEAASIQAAWDTLAPGKTLWIGSGTYAGTKLSIASGGSEGKLKTVAGKDTGGGLPVFQGTFKKDNPAKSGTTFISLAEGVDYFNIQDLQVRDYSIGIATKAGGHQGVRIRNFDVTGSREGMALLGGGTVDNPAAASHDWEITDCEFKNYTKRGIRFRNGNYNMKITNCIADGGGQEWATEPFQIGFSVEGAKEKTDSEDHSLTFINCVGLNNYHNNGEKYWNADGFTAERGVKNVKYLNCRAFDNTDGGWDLKAEEVLFENCIAVGNKRNYRLWGKTNTLKNCLSASSIWPGGSGGALGLWTSGEVVVDKSTFLDAPIGVDPGGKVTVTNSVIARSKSHPATQPLNQVEGVTFQNTAFWDEASARGDNPGLGAIPALWDGAGNVANSKLAAQGFSSAGLQALPFERRLPLIAGVRGARTDAPKAAPVAQTPKTPEQLAADAAMVPTLTNGGFEEDLSGWEKAKAPAFAVKAEGAAQGGKFLAVNTEKRVEAAQKISGLVAGETYVLSYQSRGNTAPDARIILRGYPQGAYLKIGTPSTKEAWTPQSLKFTAKSSEVALQISVRAAGKLDLDDFSIKRAN